MAKITRVSVDCVSCHNLVWFRDTIPMSGDMTCPSCGTVYRVEVEIKELEEAKEKAGWLTRLMTGVE